MLFTALGGAREIGASCYLLEIDGKSILLDAGLRYAFNQKDFASSTPLFDLLGRVDVVCISHAHLDHVGALPLVLDRFPKALAFMTIPTFPIAITMLLDVIRRVEEYRDQYAKHPLRSLDMESVEGMADRTFTTKFNLRFKPFKERNIFITFLPAGHVLGAAGILVEGEEGTAFYTGDFSGAIQRTVPGAQFNPNADIDVLITETTYGNHFHRDRRREEDAAADLISETVVRGGCVLMPSFAFGCAQEILLMLQEAQAMGKIPLVPIFVDGLVRTICDYYEEMIRPGCIFRKNAPAPLIRVDSPETRRYVFAGSPCIVVASSGGLIGGPAVSYAQELLPQKKNALAFVSYQDEESPGRVLANLSQGETIRLGGQEVLVEAKIHKFHFSAHADQGELVKTALSLKPKSVIGVHGETASVECFEQALLAAGFTGKVLSPANGEEFDL